MSERLPIDYFELSLEEYPEVNIDIPNAIRVIDCAKEVEIEPTFVNLEPGHYTLSAIANPKTPDGYPWWIVKELNVGLPLREWEKLGISFPV